MGIRIFIIIIWWSRNALLKKVILLRNQAWVHSPVCSKANLLTPGCGEESAALIVFSCQTRCSEQLMLKKLKLSDGLQGSILKGKVRERSCGGCDQLVYNSLIGWWWGNRVVSQGLTLWILRLQLDWGLCAHGYHVVNFFHLVGALVSVKQLRNVYQILSSIYFREELKILWLMYGWLAV